MTIDNGTIICAVLDIFLYICCYRLGVSFHQPGAVLFMMIWCTVLSSGLWFAIIGLKCVNQEEKKRCEQENIDRLPKKLL
jgi:hypothetical protein